MKKAPMRFRNAFIVFGSVLTILLLVLADPDLAFVKDLPIGATTINTLIKLFTGTLGATLLFVVGKAMLDYKVADFEELGKNATRTPEGAGKYAIAVALTKVAYAIVIVAAFNV